MTAFKQLEKAITEKNSHLVLGLDPDIEEISPETDLYLYLKNIIDQTSDHIVAIKPNLAFYEAAAACETLVQICAYAKSKNLLVILDAKRGDIMNTQKHYAIGDLKNYAPDIITLNPYMGAADVIDPYLQQNPDICVFPVIATSNPAARQIQDIPAGGLAFYQQMMLNVRACCDPTRVGYVVGATNPKEMREIRSLELEKNLTRAWVLAPGLGKQGGDLAFAKYAGKNVIFPISSGLTHKKYLNGQTPEEAAIYWKEAINSALLESDIKSISDRWAEETIEAGLIKVASTPDEATWFTLKNGTQSPVYANMRDLQSDSRLLLKTAWLIAELITEKNLVFNRIAAVPYGSLGLAYTVGQLLNIPVITPRKEGAKDHGTKDDIVGSYIKGDRVLIIEDVITSGISTQETAAHLKEKGLTVTDVVAIINREQGGEANLKEVGIYMHTLATLKTVFQTALNDDHPMKKIVLAYLK